MMTEQPGIQCALHGEKIERIMEDIQGLRLDLKEFQREFWIALADLLEAINGNDRNGLKVQVDRNTSFRRGLTALLWALFTPLYSGLLFLIFREIFQ